MLCPVVTEPVITQAFLLRLLACNSITAEPDLKSSSFSAFELAFMQGVLTTSLKVDLLLLLVC